MKKLLNIHSSFRDFMSCNLFDSDTINRTVGRMLTIIITLVLATYLLKWIQKVITLKLSEADNNQLISISGFLRCLLYILIVITVLSSAGVNLTLLLTVSAAGFVGLGFALKYLFQIIFSGILMIMDQFLHVGDDTGNAFVLNDLIPFSEGHREMVLNVPNLAFT